MVLDSSANDTDLHRKSDVPIQDITRNLPGREGLIAAVASRVRMCASLNGTPVVPRCDHDRINPIHHALIMGARPVGVRVCEAVCRSDGLRDLHAIQRRGCQAIDWDADRGAHEAPVSQVGQYLDAHFGLG